MIKKCFPFLFLLLSSLFFSVPLFSQNLEIEYLYKRYPIRDLKPTDNPYILNSRKIKYNTQVSYTLLQQGQESVFKRSGNEKQDIEYLNKEFTTELESDVYYKNFSENVMKAEIKIWQKHSMEDNFPLFEWELQNETKNILGFKCYKAKTFDCLSVSEIHAWYAPDLAINNGPLYFNGLPGLILRIDFIIEKKLASSMTANTINEFDAPCSKLEAVKTTNAVKFKDVCKIKEDLFKNAERSYKKQ